MSLHFFASVEASPMSDFSPPEAVVICTRNRPKELGETLESVGRQSGAENRLVLVVDGSDSEEAETTSQAVRRSTNSVPARYYRYPNKPAGTRQRNKGIDLLPASVEIVHFIDDDVTLKEGYFSALTSGLRNVPSLHGIGGIIESDDGDHQSTGSLIHRLFLLRASKPSRVLPSGHTTPAWPTSNQALQPAEWLSTCASSYRRHVFTKHRFDPAAEGPSPRLEDLDFSYRVAQDGPLAVATAARCVHHVSPKNRRSTLATSREYVIRRYWFVDKNLPSFSYHIAFWWSMLGKFFILIASSHPDSRKALRGFLRGVTIVWNRNHSLLRPT